MIARLLIAAVAAALFCTTVAAAPMAAFTVSSPGGFYNDDDYSLGWKFTVGSNSIQVVKLGLFRELVGFGPKDVGIYGMDGGLLGSASVSAADALDNFYRYVDIAPLILSANTSYVIAGQFTRNQGNYAYNPGGFTVSPDLSFDENRYVASTALAFPTLSDQGVIGYFGPNFQYESAPVPEPGTYLLFAAGFSLLAARRFRA